MSLLRWFVPPLFSSPFSFNPDPYQLTRPQVLFATGDVMAQHLVEKVPTHNYARTGRMALYGGAIFGPAATTWFAFLARRINFPARPTLTIAARVLTDQTVFASTNLFCFLSSMALMEGGDPRDKLRSSYFTALEKNWMVWPAVQAINFRFVPLEHRVLVVNVVSLGWNCYLSYVNSQAGKKETVGEKVKEKAEEIS
ncbi:Protein required for ethanol metabolism [Puttea exsequens]|nr:Protein required for ethanol metabolism [Puttea exsequens]